MKNTTAIPVDTKGNAAEPEYLAVSASSSGDTTLVAADSAGRRIRVIGGYLSASGGAADVKFKSGSTDITGVIGLADNGSFPIHPAWWGRFQTDPGEPLVLNVSAAAAVGGWIEFVRVPA